jgi:hypothetical protein
MKIKTDGSAIQRAYSVEDLRELWDFCQQDFDRFLALIVWLETLPDRRAAGRKR